MINLILKRMEIIRDSLEEQEKTLSVLKSAISDIEKKILYLKGAYSELENLRNNLSSDEDEQSDINIGK